MKPLKRHPPIVPPSSGGVSAGFRAGLVMACLFVGREVLEGPGAGYPARLVAAAWMGEAAFDPGVWPILMGAATHFVISALLGAVFAALIGRGMRAATALGAGMMYGIGVWLGMTYFVVPVMDPLMSAFIETVPFWWLALHLAFGACLMETPGRRQQGTEELLPSPESAEPTTFY